MADHRGELNSLYMHMISKYKVSEIMKWFNKTKSCGILRAMAMNKPNKKYNNMNVREASTYETIWLIS